MSKKFIKVQSEKQVPSFLVNLTIPKDLRIPPKPITSDNYLGPIFFGKDNNYQPPLHSTNFSTFRDTKKTPDAKETITDLFYPKSRAHKPIKVNKEFKPVFKQKPIYSDPYSHRAVGTRKAFVQAFVRPPVIDLGESTSTIEGETVLEIPFCRLKKVCSGSSATEIQLVKLSDIKEKKRISMPYKERISHIHFPKEFATVTVIGPTIPAAITITKLPSKRKKSVTSFLKVAKVRGPSKDEKTEEVEKKPEVDLSNAEDLEVKHPSDVVDNLAAKETEEKSPDREFEDGHNTEEINEKTEEDKTVEVDEEHVADEEGEETESIEINEKPECNEELGQENAEETGEEDPRN